MRKFPIKNRMGNGLLAAGVSLGVATSSLANVGETASQTSDETATSVRAQGTAQERVGVTGTAAKKLASYFEAKTEFGELLQLAISGTTGNNDFRLITLNGPAYPVGSLIAADNSLELESRDCVVADEDLPPPDPWNGLPSWSSESALDLTLGLPSIWQSAISDNETSLDAGFSMDRQSFFQIEDISQVFLSRSELRRAFAEPDCKAALEEIPAAEVIYVRGLIYGRETLRSAKAFNAGVDLSLTGEDSGDFSFAFSKNGAFELKEDRLVPKFAVVTKLVLTSSVRSDARLIDDETMPLLERPTDQDVEGL